MPTQTISARIRIPTLSTQRHHTKYAYAQNASIQARSLHARRVSVVMTFRDSRQCKKSGESSQAASTPRTGRPVTVIEVVALLRLLLGLIHDEVQHDVFNAVHRVGELVIL